LEDTATTLLIVYVARKAANSHSVIVCREAALTVPKVSVLALGLRSLVETAGKWRIPIVAIRAILIASTLRNACLSVPEPSVGAGGIKGTPEQNASVAIPEVAASTNSGDSI